MFDVEHPVYAPLLMPSDRDAVAAGGVLEAAIVSATCGVYERLQPLWREAREHAALLLVDPRTAAFQFEGYVSTEDVRSLPYSPGQRTLGALWSADGFHRDGRRALIAEVLGLQRHLEADALLAPYFFIPTIDSDWLPVAVDVAREARAGAGDRPLGAHVMIDIDTILPPGAAEECAAAFTDTGADFFALTVVDFEEVKAPPHEARRVLELVGLLSRSAPTLLWYAGRAGLAAVAAGAAGYAGGALELEAYPRRYLREGMVNLHANTHYLPGAMLRLPVRAASAVTGVCPATEGTDVPPANRLLQRERVRRALATKTGEVQWLREVAPERRRAALTGRIDEALGWCTEAHEQLRNEPEALFTRSDFHYLEVLREVCGGAAAEVLHDPGF